MTRYAFVRTLFLDVVVVVFVQRGKKINFGSEAKSRIPGQPGRPRREKIDPNLDTLLASVTSLTLPSLSIMVAQ